ncbi:hypothetical protein RJ639_034929 [Escallonia herrerae]|uniref:Uncharacterized protein n=1 Tax=Escallonia herrerae TaxID=1293975 RepID=A0AA88WWZ4_9ASTE|nr:hypothetical protein RJ639_034929 [Escallonia herrerae]
MFSVASPLFLLHTSVATSRPSPIGTVLTAVRSSSISQQGGDAAPFPPIRVAKRVVLVRQGQSTWNEEGRIQGSSNFAVLTQKGEAQAETNRLMLLHDTFDACFARLPLKQRIPSSSRAFRCRPEATFTMVGKLAISFSALKVASPEALFKHPLIAKFSSGRHPIQAIPDHINSSWDLKAPAAVGYCGHLWQTFKGDQGTLNLSHTIAARICVEVDLSKALPSVWTGIGNDGEGFWQKLVSEGNVSFCPEFHLHGHTIETCRKAPPKVNRAKAMAVHKVEKSKYEQNRPFNGGVWPSKLCLGETSDVICFSFLESLSSIIGMLVSGIYMDFGEDYGKFGFSIIVVLMRKLLWMPPLLKLRGTNMLGEALALRDVVQNQLTQWVVCFSPLNRSKRTAEVIWGARKEEIITDSDLREIDLYSFQGLLKHEVKAKFGLGTEYFRTLLQSNCGVSVLDFIPGQSGGSPSICLNRLNQTPSSPFAAGSSGGRSSSNQIILVCQGSSKRDCEDNSPSGDVSLDMLGIIQSQKTAELLLDLKVKTVVSSPTLASIETANSISRVQEAADVLGANSVPRCVEMKQMEDLDVRNDGVLTVVWEKSGKVWKLLLDELSGESETGNTVVAVADLAIHIALLGHCLNVTKEWMGSFHLDAGSISVLDFPEGPGGRGVIRCINYTAHLGRWSLPITRSILTD